MGDRVVLGLKHIARSQEMSAQIPAWLLQTHYTMKFKVTIFCHYISSMGGESWTAVKTQTIVSHSEPCYAGVKSDNGTVNTSKSHLCYSVHQWDGNYTMGSWIASPFKGASYRMVSISHLFYYISPKYHNGCPDQLCFFLSTMFYRLVLKTSILACYLHIRMTIILLHSGA